MPRRGMTNASASQYIALDDRHPCDDSVRDCPVSCSAKGFRMLAFMEDSLVLARRNAQIPVALSSPALVEPLLAARRNRSLRSAPMSYRFRFRVLSDKPMKIPPPSGDGAWVSIRRMACTRLKCAIAPPRTLHQYSMNTAPMMRRVRRSSVPRGSYGVTCFPTRIEHSSEHSTAPTRLQIGLINLALFCIRHSLAIIRTPFSQECKKAL